ncbi:FtsX-like permease family protein [Paenibacillus allorhizosphaerae]|uniref:ABC transporter permease protein YxdM n=1 Tax=Paenibacillus allorhizosphaerae TaxID=2849866 RepID=A0ABM8VDG3_9BACL|nr:ABC transporter permease [Paenibacillus allorhizosphaerae]CAG7626840.1 ABC transporter permease protein YxdM [Paenibacillus allorhizosphaerae]
MTFRQFAIRNVSRNKRTYAAFFLSSAFSVMIFFIYAAFIFHPAISHAEFHRAAVMAMTLAEYIVYIFSIFFVFYSVSSFLKSRKREFGVLVMHGMTYHQLRWMVFIENMMIGVTAIAVGLIVGMLFVKLFMMTGASMMGMGEMPFYMPYKAIALTGAAFIALFLIISMFTAVFVRASKPIDLLKGSAKPKPEPKSSIVLSLLAAMLLLAGYVTSFLVKGVAVAAALIPVTVMVTVGTYFMFSQLSVTVIRAIRGNRYLFLRKTNVLLFSDLAYRMKDNARMFFLVTIVTTVSICAMGTFMGFQEAFHKQITNSYPFAYSYLSAEGSKALTRQIETMEDELATRNVRYDKLETRLRSYDLQDGKSVMMVRLSDYNKLAKAVNQPLQSLKGNEAAAIWIVKNQPLPNRNWTVKGTDITFNVKSVVDQTVFPPVVGGPVLVVPDEAIDTAPAPKKNDVYVAYHTEASQSTAETGEAISKRLESAKTSEYYWFASSALVIAQVKQGYNLLLFVGLFVSCVFFVASGSFLYFRLYTDLNDDKEKYRSIRKLGLTDKELVKVASTQIALLFFIPFAVALIHSSVALYALHNMLQSPVVRSAATVCSVFLAAQFVYFLFIRARYLKHLKRAAG